MLFIAEELQQQTMCGGRIQVQLDEGSGWVILYKLYVYVNILIKKKYIKYKSLLQYNIKFYNIIARSGLVVL